VAVLNLLVGKSETGYKGFPNGNIPIVNFYLSGENVTVSKPCAEKPGWRSCSKPEAKHSKAHGDMLPFQRAESVHLVNTLNSKRC
jgi:hypothetical protein